MPPEHRSHIPPVGPPHPTLCSPGLHPRQAVHSEAAERLVNAALSLNVPDAQAAHAPWLVLVTLVRYCPDGQGCTGRQGPVDAVSEKVPGEQASHSPSEVPPQAARNRPAGQLSQGWQTVVDLPVLGLNVLAGHGVQLPALSPEQPVRYNPAGQGSHLTQSPTLFSKVAGGHF